MASTYYSDGTVEPDQTMHLIDLGGDCSNQLLSLTMNLKHSIQVDYLIVKSLLISNIKCNTTMLMRSSYVKLLSRQDDEFKVTDSNNCSPNCDAYKIPNALFLKVNEIKQAFKCLKPNQRKLLILVCPNNHGWLDIEYQFLGANIATQVINACKQPPIPDGKAFCLIVVGTRKVSAT